MLITNGKQNGIRMMKKKIPILIDIKLQSNFFNTFHHPNLPFVVFSSDQQNDGEEIESPVKHLIGN